MAVSLVGGVSPARVRRALARAVPVARPGPRRGRDCPATAPRATVRLRRADLAQSYLVRIAAAPPDPRSVLALSLAIEIVGADPDARLFQEVRERLGLGYDVGACVEHGSDWAVAVISASAAREHEDRLRETVERTCREAAGGFSRRRARSARARRCATASRAWRSLALERALAHAVRAIGRQPSLARSGARPRRTRAGRRRASVAARAERSHPHGRPRGVMRAITLVACALWASAIAHAQPSPMGPCGPIARRHEAIELPGMRLRRLGAQRLEHLGLVAYRGGVARPIPFQFDERVPGKGIAMAGGPEPLRDDHPGILDPDDLLVFMACDAGERAPGGAPPAAAGREIRIDDPLDHTTGWAYLVVATDPPLTGTRYVEYDAAHDSVVAARYRVGMIQALPAEFAVGLSGPMGPNLMDGLRLRAEATLHAGLAHWTISERDGKHELVAWTAGPVRVVRRSRHKVDIGMGIRLTAGLAHTYFYAEHVYAPGAMKLPFSPSVFFRDITAMGGVDLHGLEGWHYLAPGIPPPGFTIDGHMDQREQGFEGRGTWFALVGHDQAILVAMTMSENLSRTIPLSLVYIDDASRRAPPEVVPGSVPLVGISGRDGQKLRSRALQLPDPRHRAARLPSGRRGARDRAAADAAHRRRHRASRPRTRASSASVRLRTGWRSPLDRLAIEPASRLMRRVWPVWNTAGASTSSGGTPASSNASAKPSA